jgi:predicted O-methyltransferase YrrM
MKAKIKRLISFLRNGRPHPLQTAASVDFRSGLGDSALVLYGLCRSMKPKVCVEIGSARGKSACYVGTALKENGTGHLYAIDPHTKTNWNDAESVDTYEIMRDNLNKFRLQDVVTMVRKTSSETLNEWTEKIDLIFIDGDHSYEGVKADWEGFRPHLNKFGLVVFHDTLWDLRPDPKWARSDMGVPRFVEELRQQGYPVLTIERDCGVSIVQPRINGNPLTGGGAS